MDGLWSMLCERCVTATHSDGMRKNPVIDSAEMAGAAANHEQVPDRVHVRNAVGQVKRNAGGIDNAAGDGQLQGRFTEVGHQVG